MGCEEDGKGEELRRPVLILKKYNKNQVLVLPLSSKIKEHKYRYNFVLQNKEQSVLLSQSRIVD